MENQIKLEIESLQFSMTFFLMLIEDNNSGLASQGLIEKYAEDWYTQWSYTMTPWSIEVFIPLFKLLQEFENSNPNDILLSYYWSKFDKFVTIMWKITPQLSKILNMCAWLGSKAPEHETDCEPYYGAFYHTPLKLINKELQVIV